MNYTDVMIDIETMDTTLHSVIVSIAAVKFNLDEHEDNFQTWYQNVDPKSCRDIGLTISPETVAWWRERPKEARDALIPNQVSIQDALSGLSDFLSYDMSKYSCVWSQGTVFDFGNLQNAMEACGRKSHPWKYWQICDSRTIFTVSKVRLDQFPRNGTYHNALDDCMTQIHALRKVLTE